MSTTYDTEYTLERDGVDYNLYIELEGCDYEPRDESVGIMSGGYLYCQIVSCKTEDNVDFKLTDAEENKISEEFLDKINEAAENEYYDGDY